MFQKTLFKNSVFFVFVKGQPAWSAKIHLGGEKAQARRGTAREKMTIVQKFVNYCKRLSGHPHREEKLYGPVSYGPFEKLYGPVSYGPFENGRWYVMKACCNCGGAVEIVARYNSYREANEKLMQIWSFMEGEQDYKDCFVKKDYTVADEADRTAYYCEYCNWREKRVDNPWSSRYKYWPSGYK